MTEQPSVLFPSGYRSESVLSSPIKDAIRARNEVEILEHPLLSGSYAENYMDMCDYIELYKPDYALIVADRIEMCAAAAACFNQGVPFAHMYSGTGNNIGTADDVNRHAITLWSTVQLCESWDAALRVHAMRSAVGLPCANIHVVGITHLDGVSVVPYDIPKVPYDLVLYNPPGTHLSPEAQQKIIVQETEEILRLVQDSGNYVVMLHPAPDRGHIFISLNRPILTEGNGKIIPSLPRSQFFYLLQHCQNFISNSSTTYYEAPHLLPKERIKHIGMRNKNRDSGPYMTGASGRIAELMGYYLCRQKSGNVIGQDPR